MQLEAALVSSLMANREISVACKLHTTDCFCNLNYTCFLLDSHAAMTLSALSALYFVKKRFHFHKTEWHFLYGL
jgi:hypothetical protein